jgi:PRTRC genetic system ThiF family protein
MTHTLPSQLLTQTVRVAVVGCGGSGSAIAAGLPLLHQAMLAFGHPGGLHVTLIDGDSVSPTNCVRQPFHAGEVGHPKAQVLATRINTFYDLRWRAIPAYLTPHSNLAEFDLVIGCVDTRAARRALSKLVANETSKVTYWLDLGNTSEAGQFILGQPKNCANTGPNRLHTVAELYPEILDARQDKDDGPSCSAVEALQRQAPFVNQVIAANALSLLARLFRHGSIDHAGAFINLATGQMVPVPSSN